jgi:DNA-binding HxlR family transcriptional regulator
VFVKGYRQYCAVARGLDLVGERWTLLVVRELLALGPTRFSDIEDGIPGIPPALLSERLKAMEQAGIVERPEPGRGARYSLTDWGRGLEPVLAALGTWAGPTLAVRGDDDRFQAHWLAVPVRTHLIDHQPDRPSVRLALECVHDQNGGEDERLVAAIGGRIEVWVSDRDPADATLRGDAGSLVRTLAGVCRPGQPGAATLTGDVQVFDRVAPAPR